SAQAFRDCISHLAGYVAHDLTTPLGSALEQLRRRPQGFHRSPFRGFGTYGVWFPRGLLLRAAAQKICTSLIREWHLDAPPHQPERIEAVVNQIVADPRLKPDAVQKPIEQEAPRGPEGGPAEQIERWLTGLEGQIESTARRQEAGVWARNVWDQAREFIGTRPTSETEITVRRSRVSKALDVAIGRAADMWGNEFIELTRHLEGHPGPRVAAIESALRKLADLADAAAATMDKKVQNFGVKSRQCRTDGQSALDACQAGSGTFSFFGGRSNRSLRHLLDQLRTFARVRFQEDLLDATARFYRALRGKIEDRLRHLSFCRTRLVHLLQHLESPLL